MAYFLKPGIKEDPVRRWALPDRIFFGHGACHILAGVYLTDPPLPGFYAERIVPDADYRGNHVYVTDGTIAFDYHGYACRDRLLAHWARTWSRVHADWSCRIEPVDFDLLSTPALNRIRHRGPDQYLHDPIPRARRFIAARNHAAATRKLKRELA